MTTEQQEAPDAVAGRSNGASTPLILPPRDVRRKRPPLLSFVLRLETLRRTTRVLSLLALDFIGVVGALFTALGLKLAFRGDFSVENVWHGIKPWIAFAYLVTVLMFARVDLYADRPRRPGTAKIATALFQAVVIALVFALANGQHFSSYYIFYGSLVIGVAYIGALRQLHLQVTGWLLTQAGYQRRALIVGSGKHIEAVAHALSGRSRTRVAIVGYISLTPRPQNGLRSLGKLDGSAGCPRHREGPGGDHRRSGLPARSRRSISSDFCHQRGVIVHVAPSTMEILFERAEFVPGASRPTVPHLRPPVLEGIDFIVKRAFDLVRIDPCVLALLSPILLVIACAIKLSSRGSVIYRSVRPGIGGRPLRASSSARCATTPSRPGRARAAQRADGRPVQDPPRSAVTAVGRFLRRFSLDELRQLMTCVRGEMSLVGPRPLPMRDFERLEEWHKKRYLVLPGITGLWQVSGRSELDFDDLVRLDFLYLERWSMLLDLSILLKTIPAVISRARRRSPHARALVGSAAPCRPTDRFVISFAAEPPQEPIPYGRWADTLRGHVPVGVPRDRHRGRGHRRSRARSRGSPIARTPGAPTSRRSRARRGLRAVRVRVVHAMPVGGPDRTSRRGPTSPRRPPTPIPSGSLTSTTTSSACWRGEQGKTADMTLVWGVPMVAGGVDRDRRAGEPRGRSVRARRERFTLVAPDNYRGDYVEIKLWGRRGEELAVESLYVDEGDDDGRGRRRRRADGDGNAGPEAAERVKPQEPLSVDGTDVPSSDGN